MKQIKIALAVLLGASIQSSVSAIVFAHGPYLVFFDLNSAKLRPEGIEVLEGAAQSYLTTGERFGNTIFLAGYTDRSGTERFNRGLADRRTKAVRALLIEKGINPERIASLPYGEDPNTLRVATPDGVRHDQNRRVEVIFEYRDRSLLPDELKEYGVEPPM